MGWGLGSCRFRRPTPLSCRFAGPDGATAGEVLAMADQPLVELAGEQGDAVEASVVAEPMAGHADLAA